VEDFTIPDLTSQHAEDVRAIAESPLRNPLSKVQKKIKESLNTCATLEGTKSLNLEMHVYEL
jgi:hypothetical protein